MSDLCHSYYTSTVLKQFRKSQFIFIKSISNISTERIGPREAPLRIVLSVALRFIFSLRKCARTGVTTGAAKCPVARRDSGKTTHLTDRPTARLSRRRKFYVPAARRLVGAAARAFRSRGTHPAREAVRATRARGTADRGHYKRDWRGDAFSAIRKPERNRLYTRLRNTREIL